MIELKMFIIRFHELASQSAGHFAAAAVAGLAARCKIQNNRLIAQQQALIN